MEQTFEKRKKIIYDFICDDFYVPMKLKELQSSLSELIRRMHEDLALLRSKDKPMIFLSQRTMRMGHFTWTRWKLS